MDNLAEIEPNSIQRIIDLVEEAGVDVSDWSNFAGASPSKNPKYCYNWSFLEPESVVVLCLWYDDMLPQDDNIIYDLNYPAILAGFSNGAASTSRGRATKMRDDIAAAMEQALPVRVIVCQGKRKSADNSAASRVKFRHLDREPWSIRRVAADHYELRRGGPQPAFGDEAPEYEGYEGEVRRWFRVHRRREARLRREKIRMALQNNGGRLICEVPGCGFDFFARYGGLGRGYAHVHHKEQLSTAPSDGRSVKLNDLAVVCANCHAMIHVGGECRPLEGLVPR